MKTVFIALLVIAFVSPANAQTRCECEYDDWVDDCDAKFERIGNWIKFESDTKQCSRIDWNTDAQPRLTIVEDGKETVELVGVSENAAISISSCKVCKDALFASKQPNLSRDNESDPAGPVAGQDSEITRLVTSWKNVYRQCGITRSVIIRDTVIDLTEANMMQVSDMDTEFTCVMEHLPR